MSQKAYQSIMDANIQATQFLQESYLEKGFQILKKIEIALQQERIAPTIPLSQINHLLSVVTNNIGCYYYRKDNYSEAEKYLKLSIKYLQQSIQDETLLITLINLVILFFKNEKYQEARTYIEQSFSELNSLQDCQLNPKIRLFLGGQQSPMILQQLEAILLFYSGLTFQNLKQNEQALNAWKKAREILKNNKNSPYFLLIKSKIQNLEAEETAQKNKQLHSSRSYLKSDRVQKFLQQYEEQQQQQKWTQRIKSKIGNQLSQHQNPSSWEVSQISQQNHNKIEHNEKKIEINNYFSDQKKVELQINVKDLLQHKNITQREKIIKKRPTQHLEIIEKLNKTHNEIYKSYLAQRNNNGSKTQRGDSSSRDMDIRIKINDKSTQSALLQTLINKSNEKKSIEHNRESPDICHSPQQFYNLLQKSQTKQGLLRSGSQGNISNNSPNKTNNPQKKQQNITVEPRTHRPLSDAYNQTLRSLQQCQQTYQDRQRITKIQKIVDTIKIGVNKLREYQQEEKESIDQIVDYLSNNDKSIESVISLE